MDAVVIMTFLSIFAFGAALVATFEARRHHLRSAFLSGLFAVGLFSIFAVVAVFTDFRTKLSNIGVAILTAVAAAGLAELLHSAKSVIAYRYRDVELEGDRYAEGNEE